MSRIFVSGSMAYDRIMNFDGLFKDHFLPDKLHNINLSFQVNTLVQHFGGTAGNIAYSLALLGEKPTILANKGTDFESYAAYLKEMGISIESLAAVDELTSTAHIMTDKGDNQIASFYMGAGMLPYAGSAEMSTGDIVIVGAGNPADMEAQPAQAKKSGATFLFDPGQALPALSADVLRAGIKGAAALFVNDYELALIMNKTGWSEADIAREVSALIITLGKEGSRVITKEGETRIVAAKVEEVQDPTGAGDAYRAGYIKGMTLGRQPAECAKIASVAGAYAVEHKGTQNHRYTLAEFKERYAQTFGEPLEI